MKNIIKWLIVIFIFVFGIAVGTSSATTVKVVDDSKCQNDLLKYKLLKTIDDEGFNLSMIVFTETSNIFGAMADGDYKKANEIMNKISGYTPKIAQVGAERQKVLKELGY